MKPEKRDHEPQIDWPGEYEFHFGMCPTCHKTDGYIRIEGWEWFYCRTHRVRWCAGLREVATCRLQTVIQPEKLCNELELDSFTEVEESTWCRFCHVVIDDGERGWDSHLAAKHRCPYCEIDLGGEGDYRQAPRECACHGAPELSARARAETCGKAASQPSSRTGENPPYGMIGGTVETSASFEARHAPLSYPTAGATSDGRPYRDS